MGNKTNENEYFSDNDFMNDSADLENIDLLNDDDFLKDIMAFNDPELMDNLEYLKSSNEPDNFIDNDYNDENYDDFLQSYMDTEPGQDIDGILDKLDNNGSDQAHSKDTKENNKQDQQESYDENLEEDDLDSLLDLLDFNESSNNNEDINHIDQNKEESDYSNKSSDMSDIFSDVLGVVSSREDMRENSTVDDLLDSVADNGNVLQDDVNGKSSKQRKKKESKQKKEKQQGTDNKTLLVRLFGNVKDENPKKPKKKELTEEEKLQIATKKSEAKKKKKEENKEKAAETKKIKLELKKAKQASKAEKKRIKKEQMAAEEVVDEGRINRVGATIVVCFFIIITITIIFGTNSIAYNSSITSANNYFNGRRYVKAYNELVGIDIKKKDKEMLKKVRTVMHVHRQLESYYNYKSLKSYDEALHSLLKGLDKYDTYIDQGIKYGVDSDLDYIKEQIVSELKKQYNLSEKEAKNILNMKSKEEYSNSISDIVKAK